MKLPKPNPGNGGITVISAAYILLGVQGCFLVLTLPSLITSETGRSAWLFLSGAGVWTLLMMAGIAWLTVRTGMSWRELHAAAFGPIFGFVIGAVWLVAMVGTNAYTIQKYVRLLHLYEFPNAQPIFYTILMTLAGLFAAWGGLHALSGLFVASCVLQLILLVTSFISVIPYIQWKYVTPFTSVQIHNPLDTTVYAFSAFAGLETGVLLFGFIRSANKTGMVRMVTAVTVIGIVLQLLLVEICMSIFGLEMLNASALPTISMMRLVRLPFIEQLDQFGVGLLFFRLLPIVSFYLWASADLFRSLAFRTRPYGFHLILQAVLVLAAGFGFMYIPSHGMDRLVMAVSASWFAIYAPTLFMLAWLRTSSVRIRRKEG